MVSCSELVGKLSDSAVRYCASLSALSLAGEDRKGGQRMFLLSISGGRPMQSVLLLLQLTHPLPTFPLSPCCVYRLCGSSDMILRKPLCGQVVSIIPNLAISLMTTISLDPVSYTHLTLPTNREV